MSNGRSTLTKVLGWVLLLLLLVSLAIIAYIFVGSQAGAVLPTAAIVGALVTEGKEVEVAVLPPEKPTETELVVAETEVAETQDKPEEVETGKIETATVETEPEKAAEVQE